MKKQGLHYKSVKLWEFHIIMWCHQGPGPGPQGTFSTGPGFFWEPGNLKMPLVKPLIDKCERATLDCLKVDRVTITTAYQCSATPHFHLGYYTPPPNRIAAEVK